MTPILIQNAITNFVSLLDNIMVGQVGTEQMSGVAIVNQLIFVFNLCIFGGLAGSGILTAQFYGKRDTEGVRNTFRVKLYIAIVSLLIFTGIFLSSGDQLIGLFLHEGEGNLDLAATLVYGKGYLNIMLLQLLPFAITQLYASTLKEIGQTRLPMTAGVAAVFVNLVFNYIFIFGKFGFPAMGVAGAAIATVIARFVECAIVALWTHRHKNENEFIVGVYSTLKVPKHLAKQIAVLGMPLLVNELLWSGGMATLNQCYSMRGLEVVSAVNISSTVSNLFFCVFLAIGNSVAIIVGQLLGAGEIERAIDEDRKIIVFAVTSCILVGIIMAIFAPLIPQIYNTTETVKSIAVKLLLVSAVTIPFQAFTNCCYFTLRSGGKTIITFLFDSAFLWVIGIPTAFVISRYTGIGIIPMFIIIQSLDLLKCILGFILVKKKTWVSNLVSE